MSSSFASTQEVLDWMELDEKYRVQHTIPRPKGNHKAKPREEEYSAILVDGVENRYRTSFPVYWIDRRGFVKVREGEPGPHCSWWHRVYTI